MKIEELNSWTVNEIEVSYSTGLKPGQFVKIKSANDAHRELEPYFKKEMEFRENFYVLYTNNANEIIGVQKLSTGGVQGTVLDVRIILGVAVKILATGIILSHNHPSGTLQPSTNDINWTKKIKDACKILDIELHDHIILSKYGFCSLKTEGII